MLQKMAETMKKKYIFGYNPLLNASDSGITKETCDVI